METDNANSVHAIEEKNNNLIYSKICKILSQTFHYTLYIILR